MLTLKRHDNKTYLTETTEANLKEVLIGDAYRFVFRPPKAYEAEMKESLQCFYNSLPEDIYKRLQEQEILMEAFLLKLHLCEMEEERHLLSNTVNYLFENYFDELCQLIIKKKYSDGYVIPIRQVAKCSYMDSAVNAIDALLRIKKLKHRERNSKYIPLVLAFSGYMISIHEHTLNGDVYR